jgi:hypothetical protein
VLKEDYAQDVRVWSDFLRPHLHPRSIHLISSFTHNNPETPFDRFCMGENALARHEEVEALEERVRFFMEECDHTQGIHVIHDIHNGFAGVAHAALQLLRDEYEKKTIIVFPVLPIVEYEKQISADFHTLNIAATMVSGVCACVCVCVCVCVRCLCAMDACVCVGCWVRVCGACMWCVGAGCNPHAPRTKAYNRELSNLTVPLSVSRGWAGAGVRKLPRLLYDASSNFHTSAILAAALDTFSLAYRMREAPTSMSTVVSGFSVPSRLGMLSFAMPVGRGEDAIRRDLTLSDILSKAPPLHEAQLFTPLCPSFPSTEKPTCLFIAARGIPEDALCPSEEVLMSRGAQGPLDRCTSAEDMLLRYLGQTSSAGSFRVRLHADRKTHTQTQTHKPRTQQVTEAKTGFPTGAPFPRIFASGRGAHVSAAALLENTTQVQVPLLDLVKRLGAVRYYANVPFALLVQHSHTHSPSPSTDSKRLWQDEDGPVRIREITELLHTQLHVFSHSDM